jgi:hypothetical protein
MAALRLLRLHSDSVASLGSASTWVAPEERYLGKHSLRGRLQPMETGVGLVTAVHGDAALPRAN